MQKSEIECKTVKLKWLTAPTMSSDKQNGGQKLNKDWNYNYNTITSWQSKVQSSTTITKLVKAIGNYTQKPWGQKH